MQSPFEELLSALQEIKRQRLTQAERSHLSRIGFNTPSDAPDYIPVFRTEEQAHAAGYVTIVMPCPAPEYCLVLSSAQGLWLNSATPIRFALVQLGADTARPLVALCRDREGYVPPIRWNPKASGYDMTTGHTAAT